MRCIFWVWLILSSWMMKATLLIYVLCETVVTLATTMAFCYWVVRLSYCCGCNNTDMSWKNVSKFCTNVYRNSRMNWLDLPGGNFYYIRHKCPLGLTLSSWMDLDVNCNFTRWWNHNAVILFHSCATQSWNQEMQYETWWIHQLLVVGEQQKGNLIALVCFNIYQNHIGGKCNVMAYTV